MEDAKRLWEESKDIEERLSQAMKERDFQRHGDQVQRKVHAMMREAENLEQAGKQDQAHEIRIHAEKMADELHRRHEEMMERNLAEAKERITHLRELSETAEQRGEIDKARQLWRESEEIEGDVAREIEKRERREHLHGIQQEFEEIVASAERAERQGREQEAAELRQRAGAMEREVDAARRDAEVEEMEGEIRHLRRLAEHEEAEGRHDKAEAIMGEAEGLKERLMESIQERQRGGDDEDEECDDQQVVEKMEGELEDIRAEVRQLREIIEDVREMVLKK